MKDVKKHKPSGEVTVHADMNFKFVRQSALLTKTASYSAEKGGVKYRLACNGSASDCGALQKFLNDAGLTIVSQQGITELAATLEFSDKANSAKTLTTSRATITLKVGDTELVDQAHAKAIAKLPASRIVETFAK